MSEKLKRSLAERGVDVLTPLLGSQFVNLLRHLGQEALAPTVMADTIVTSRGAAAVLDDLSIVAILIDHLTDDDAIHLCTALSQPILTPRLTLRAVDFTRANFKKTLFEWYGVPYPEPKLVTAEPSRRLSSASKLRAYQGPAYRNLRRELHSERCKVLVHMPFGAGKLRSVVTAVLEAFRSEEDGGNVLWLAPDECLAEEATIELESVWYQLGLRDLTTYTLFGSKVFPRLDGLSDAIIVTDILSLLAVIDEWRKSETETSVKKLLSDFGLKTKYIIVGDATQVQVRSIRDTLEMMLQTSDSKIIGICSAPALAVQNGSAADALIEVFGQKIVEIEDEEPMKALQSAGETDPIDVLGIESPISETIGNENEISLSIADAKKLSEHTERNKVLLNELLSFASVEDRIVFYAASDMQARLFASMLSLKGKPALAVTSDMASSQRSVEVMRFNSDEHMQILCVHGVLVSSETLERITAVVIGKPLVSSAVLYEVVGRLASSRRKRDQPVKIHAVRDPVPQYLNLVDNLASWSRLSRKD